MQSQLFNQPEFEFIGKAAYFPNQKILAVGDLHLGYEAMFRENGSLIPATQKTQTKKDLEFVFETLKKQKRSVENVIFLGDIKHFFSYEKLEKNWFLDILLLVGKYVKRENIIAVRGNHEKIAELADKQMNDFYIQGNIAFIHGDKSFKEIYSNQINIVVMAHLHPAITLEEGAKKEKYKCFLTGEFKKKQFIILPSFLPTKEGTSINRHLDDYNCIIPAKTMKNFKVHAIGEDNKIFDFGKLKDLNA